MELTGRQRVVAFVLGLLLSWLGARTWAGTGVGGYLSADAPAQHRLASSVARRVAKHGKGPYLVTRELRFDGQSMIAIDQMALLGLGQIVLDHPELRDSYLPAMRAAGDRLADPMTLRYAAGAWGSHGAAGMAPNHGHAYLGYINMGLGMLRLVDPDTKHRALNDRLTRELARRLDAAPNGLIETYPGETWPPDVAAVAGSIGLHARATGGEQRELLRRWAQRFADCAIHDSGYLVQRVHTGGCKPLDAPRGSGTAVAAYFISFAHQGLSHRLYRAIRDTGTRSLAGFAAVREYAPGVPQGAGDVNAGPILFGLSVGATGFALGAAKAHGDADLFARLYRSASLFGGRVDVGDETTFALGGLLGDALLLAMLTARSP
jgi:hypothetical protein